MLARCITYGIDWVCWAIPPSPTRKGTVMPKKPKPDAQRVQAITNRVASLAKRNAKARVKQFYTNEGAKRLAEAIVEAMKSPAMPSNLPNAEARRAWCVANNAASVQRDEVCDKVTHYRADNAIRARIGSLQGAEAISGKIAIVWAVNNAMAKADPFSATSEKVFIVRTK